ncbi:MAG: TlpA family protein disulfide reductase [Desulfobacterales bacterium]|nr:TlpA family protein disulfide reductase [Desulfobacterales bacterium]
MATPADASQRAHLGLSAGETFTLFEIEADVLIIEIFSMYCPHCQREAPLVNRLHDAIEKRGRDKGRVKLIGVGAGNSNFEVNVFREKYQVPFPLFADEDFTIHKQLGETRTPYFFAVRTRPDGAREVVYSKLGGFKDPARFLEMIVKRAGL